MLGIALALVSAITFGVNAVYSRKSLGHIRTVPATFISLIASLAVAGAVALIFEPRALFSVSLTAILVFGAVGFLNFTTGRYLIFISVRCIGASRATPVYSAAPFFSIIFAIILAGETINPMIVLGAAFIVGGMYFLLRSD